MVNVLEHIADDAGPLRGLSRLLVPGGNIVVYVPALNGLYGALDEKIGHYRRYSVWRLREVFREAGLDPVELRWVNFLAIPAWAAFGRGDVNDRQPEQQAPVAVGSDSGSGRALHGGARADPDRIERPRRWPPARLSHPGRVL